MKNLSPFDRKLTFGLFILLLAFILLLSSSFVIKANKALTISLNNSSFSPNELMVSPGQKVTWVNNASSTHTIISDDNFWDSGKIKAGESYSVLFDKPGVFPYHINAKQGIIKVTG